jgi:hypothetical protein
LMDIINKIGVPFGLMNLIIQKSDNYPQEFEDERVWQFYTEKTWITQKFIFENSISNNPPDIIQLKKLNENIKIDLVLTHWNSTIVRNNICEPRKLNEIDCNLEILENDKNNELKLNLVDPKNLRNIYKCESSSCNFGYYINGKPIWFLNILLNNF